MKTNQITKEFLDGDLKGLRYVFNSFHGFELGKVYSDCVTGFKYKIIDIKQVEIN